MSHDTTQVPAPAIAQQINEEHHAALSAATTALDHAMRCGDLLAEVKASIAHGQWQAWLADHFDGSARTARQYIQLAKSRSAIESKRHGGAILRIAEARRMIADPKSETADERLQIDPTLVPPDGHSLVFILTLDVDADFLFIEPSQHDGFYYVTVTRGGGRRRHSRHNEKADRSACDPLACGALRRRSDHPPRPAVRRRDRAAHLQPLVGVRSGGGSVMTTTTSTTTTATEPKAPTPPGSLQVVHGDEEKIAVQLDAEINELIGAGVELGFKLIQMRESGLYRELPEFDKDATFAQYLEAKQQLSRSHAKRMMQAAVVQRAISNGDKAPKGALSRGFAERHLRELVRLANFDYEESLDSLGRKSRVVAGVKNPKSLRTAWEDTERYYEKYRAEKEKKGERPSGYRGKPSVGYATVARRQNSEIFSACESRLFSCAGRLRGYASGYVGALGKRASAFPYGANPMTYSVKQVSERFAVGEHTVLAWIRAGELHAVNVGRNPGGKPKWRITAEAIQAFELLRSAQPVESQPRRKRRNRDQDVVAFY